MATFARNIVLHCPDGLKRGVDALNTLTHAFMRDGVALVAVVGKDASLIEDIIDEVCSGHGMREPYEILTFSHGDETLAHVVAFVEALSKEFEEPVQVVEF